MTGSGRIRGSAHIPANLPARARFQVPPFVAPKALTAPSLTPDDGSVGTVVTATPGTYSGVPVPAVTRIWTYAGVPIVGAVGLTFTRTSAGAGLQLSYIETALSSAGSVSQTVNAAIGKPYFSVAPTLGGTPAAGQVLTCDQGTTAGATSWAFQWKRALVDIGGEILAPYTVNNTTDPGAALTCYVTATGPGGSTTAPASNPQTIRPYFSVAPSISGTPATGQVLTCGGGTVLGGAASGYQWTRAGVDIGGEIAAPYTVNGTTDPGAVLACNVTATGPGGTTVAAASNPQTIVPYFSAAPTLGGTSYAGGSPVVGAGTVVGATSSTYTLLVNAIAVLTAQSAATVEAYTYLLAQEGLAAVVRENATGPGGTTSADSAAVTINGATAILAAAPSLVQALRLVRTDALDLTLVGAKASVWLDQSGNARNLTQGTDAQRPTRDATGLDGSRPALVFTSSLNMSSAAYDLSAMDWIARIVVWKDSDTLTRRVASRGADAAAGHHRIVVNDFTDSIIPQFRDGTNISGPRSNAHTMATAACVTCTNDSTLATNEGNVRFNGVNDLLAQTFNGNTSGGYGNLADIVGASSSGFTGAMAADVILTGSGGTGITAGILTQIAAVETIVRAMYGLP